MGRSPLSPASPTCGLFRIHPTYAITKKLEFVARYTWLDSAGPHGIKPERRYENPASRARAATAIRRCTWA